MEIRSLLEALASNADLRAALAQIGVSEKEAYRMLVGREGQVVRRADRRLARLHAEILAQRYLAKAVSTINEMLTTSEKADLKLRGAQALLALAGVYKPEAPGEKRPAKPRPLTPEEQARAGDAAQLIAQAMDAANREAAMDRAPAAGKEPPPTP